MTDKKLTLIAEILAVLILVVLILGLGLYYYTQKQNEKLMQALRSVNAPSVNSEQGSQMVGSSNGSGSSGASSTQNKSGSSSNGQNSNSSAQNSSGSAQTSNGSGGNTSSSNAGSGSQSFNLKANVVNEWAFHDTNMSRDFTASASTVLTNDDGITYSAANVIDNDSDTAWIEDNPQQGIGETLKLTYTGSSPFTFSTITFLNGYTQTQETFDLNSTPSVLKVSKNSEELGTIQLNATPQPQEAKLPEAVTLNPNDSITFTVEKVQKGLNDTAMDTSISDIRLS